MLALDSIKQGIKFYISHFGFIDYFAIIWVLLVFLVVLFLVIILIFKRPGLASILLIADIVFVFLGIFYTHKFIDGTLRKREIMISDIKQLNYSDTMIVDLNLTNKSNKAFKYCNVNLKFYKVAPNKFKNYINSLKPFYKKNNVIEDGVNIGQTKNLRLVINDFRPTDYNTTVTSECF
ncbi:DUF2393 domain-containing protein [Campylobacter fetus]|uniref:DUF2393 family protein n=1 Tax=Campylobacter fetus TaxID=196 RepID=UPI00050927CC|nr:DUF2393 family protein [Campylobacter fetus]WKW17645.1 DUF2393 domain-containing protein [Campylobacter fetus subsp. fetus]AIR78247.1 hypothetical protein (DUF2393 domain) [Campylobacter fetus subsp. fetus 04/554]EAJ5693367.1 DUF2393 domain-containing protein [Campylobacter fetus]EAJ5704064.1 DUF2393 domain-containing protein [Campylobacter fetus]EAJ9256722.1 DUF2393 domain-containing protein [Campylobacter fetus]